MNFDINYLFWLFVGGSLGYLSAYSHDLLTRYIVVKANKKRQVSIIAFVLLRIIIIAGVLFLAFSYDFIYGIICVISYFLLQWFCILVLFKGKQGSTHER